MKTPFSFLKTLPLQSSISNLTCKSHKLMLEHGLIQPSSQGMYHLMPLALRALEKLTAIVDHSMKKDVKAEKLLLSALLPKNSFMTLKRWDSMHQELIKFTDRLKRDYCLAPTHEESITQLVKNFPLINSSQLPIYFYQIGTKYRDEMRPRFGLIRAREFIMKDLYTFDCSAEEAENTYNKVCKSYEDILNKLQVPYLKVEGTQGDIGGKYSHEFHIPAECGEDRLLLCTKCNQAHNPNVFETDTCTSCSSKLVEKNGIEVGHAFFLGTKYSEAFKASFMDKNEPKLFQMGCYGIGITRLLAATIEVLSTEDQIRWPLSISPYKAIVVPPKAGSKEMSATQLAYDVASSLSALPNLDDGVIIDDRLNTTIGYRLTSLRKQGIPYAVVVAKNALLPVPKFEVIDFYNDQTLMLTHLETMEFFRALKC